MVLRTEYGVQLVNLHLGNFHFCMKLSIRAFQNETSTLIGYAVCKTVGYQRQNHVQWTRELGNLPT